MTVSIRDARSVKADQRWIESAYAEYLDDLTRASMNTGFFPAFGNHGGDHGNREPEMMARWFADDSSYPFTILRDGAPQGFALVSRPLMKQTQRSEAVDFRMAEFFIVRHARRLGLGRDAAELIFNRFDGRWEIVEFMRNQGAVAFWRSIVGDYTHGKFQESVVHGEVRHTFRSDPSHSRLRAG
jgi:predicted acetyltransferase